MWQRVLWVLVFALAVWPAGVAALFWRFIVWSGRSVRRVAQVIGSVTVASVLLVVYEPSVTVGARLEQHMVAIAPIGLVFAGTVLLHGLRSPVIRYLRRARPGSRRSARRARKPYPTAIELRTIQRYPTRRP